MTQKLRHYSLVKCWRKQISSNSTSSDISGGFYADGYGRPDDGPTSRSSSLVRGL
jgi:hypothetical protein